MEKTKNIKMLIFPFTVIIIMIVSGVLISYCCSRTNALIPIMLDMSVNSAFYAVIFVTSVFIAIIVESFKTCISDLKAAFRYPFCKKYLIGIVLILFGSQLFPFTGDFGYLQVNGEEPLRIQYEYYLLSDAIANKTNSIEMKADDFSVEYYNYTFRSGKSSSSNCTVTYATYYDYTIYLYETPMKDYIDTCKKYHKDIKVEYYPKSGIIKTIDDVALYDEDGFNALTVSLEKEEM